MKAQQFAQELKRLPPEAAIFGRFYLKDGQAVLLPIGGIRPAKNLEKHRAEIPTAGLAWVVYAEGDSGDY